MKDILITIFLSLAPFFELRGGIPYGLAAGLDFSLVFIVSVLANILIVFPIFFFLDHIHKYLINWSFYNKIFNKFLVRARRKVEKKIGTSWEFVALMLVVAIPFPGTGAYTGCLASWAFQLDRRKSVKAITLGVISAGVITTLLTLGVLNFF